MRTRWWLHPFFTNPHEPGVNDGLDFTTRAYIGDLQGFVYKLVAEDPDPDNWEFDVLFEVTSEADQALGQGEHNQPLPHAHHSSSCSTPRMFWSSLERAGIGALIWQSPIGSRW